MTPFSLTPVLTACLALSLAGCANLRWEKAGSDPAATDKVLAQCEQQAMLGARRRAASMPPIPAVVGGPGGTATVIVSPHGQNPDIVVQQSLLSECMRARGYQLVREPGEK